VLLNEALVSTVGGSTGTGKFPLHMQPAFGYMLPKVSSHNSQVSLKPVLSF
jgi:hypothetical protein